MIIALALLAAMTASASAQSFAAPAELRGIIAGSEKKLADEKFVSRAPTEVVAQARENLAALHKQLQSVEEIIQQLSAD